MHPAFAQSLLIKKPLPMRRFLVASLALHAALLGAVLVVSHFRLSPAIDLNQQPIKASLVRLGKPRDEKLLPRKEEPPPTQEAQQPQPIPEPAPAEPKAAVAIPDVKVRPLDSAANKSSDKSSADRRKQLFSAISRTSKTGGKPQDLEGQVDGDPNGDSATQEGERYWGLLSTQVRRNYDVSQTIPEQERLHLRAQVVVMIGRAGEVLRVQVVKSSGNALFDNAVISAVNKAAPFSPPPDQLRDALQKKGVALEFRP